MRRKRVFCILFFLTLAFRSWSVQKEFLIENFRAPDALSDNTARAIVCDSRGLVWIGTFNGLNRYDGFGMRRITLHRDRNSKSSPDYICALQEDGVGNMWIGTGSGLFKCSPLSGDADEVPIPCGVQAVPTLSLLPSGDILAPLGSHGVLRIDTSGTLTVEGDMAVRCLCVGENGKVWAVSEEGELFSSDASLSHFSRFFPEGQNPLAVYYIEKIYVFGHTLVIGSRFHSAVLDLETGEVKPREWKMVWDAKRRMDGNVLVASSKGLFLTDGDLEIKEKLSSARFDDPSFHGNSTVAVAEDHNAGMWVGFYYDGVSHLSTNHISFSVEKEEDAIPLPSRNNYDLELRGKIEKFNVVSAVVDSTGRIWAASRRDGVCRCDVDGVSKHYNSSLGNSHSDRIHCLFIDSKGRLWACTGGDGMMRYNPSTDAFETCVEFGQAPGGNLFAINEDRSGTLWTGTSNGLVAFNPDTGISLGLSRSSGFPFNEFNVHSRIAMCADGLLRVSIDGLVYSFNPDSLLLRGGNPKIVLSEIAVRQMSAVHSPIFTFDGNSIVLPYKANTFMLRISNTDFSLPGNLRLIYSLEGAFDGWRKADDGIVEVYGLQAGKYTLRIKALSGVGGECVEDVEWKIRVRRPLPLCAPLIILYILLFFGAVRLAVWLTRRRSEKRAGQKARAKLIEDLGREIKTPLSLISIPVSSLASKLSRHPDRTVNEEFNTVISNLGKLTGMLNDLFGLHLEEITSEIPKPPHRRTEVPPASVSMGQSGRVLLIEPDVELRDAVFRCLGARYSVFTAGSTSEAWAVLEKGPLPEMIICADFSPGLDGVAFCKGLKDNVKICHIPVLLLCAGSARIDCGADAVLEKPFDPRQLEENVSSLLSSARKTREHYSAYPAVSRKADGTASPDTTMLQRIHTFIEDNISNPDIRVEDMAAAAITSKSNLLKKMKSLTGCTPAEYILRVRLGKAAEMLQEGISSVSETAMKTGFSSPSYFTQAFRRRYGCSPKDYRK